MNINAEGKKISGDIGVGELLEEIMAKVETIPYESLGDLSMEERENIIDAQGHSMRVMCLGFPSSEGDQFESFTRIDIDSDDLGLFGAVVGIKGEGAKLIYLMDECSELYVDHTIVADSEEECPEEITLVGSSTTICMC